MFLPFGSISLNICLCLSLLSCKMAALRPHTAAKLFYIVIMSIIVANISMSLSATAHVIRPAGHSRKLGSLVEEPEVVLTYHNGPLLTNKPGSLNVHLIWYGKFSPAQRSIVGDFLQSLSLGAEANKPSVSAWWNTTHNYNTKAKAKLPSSITTTTTSNSIAMLGKQVVEKGYSLGKSLKRADIAALVKAAINSGAVPLLDNNAVLYLVLTSEDITVEEFCMSSCGFHDSLKLVSDQKSTKSRMMGKGEKHQQLLPYAWVGNSATQCPGQCAWPFHQPIYGPQTPPLVAPNGDMGIDGMIINIASVVAGAATNPFNTGYFQGDAAAPLEAVSACPGIYGRGAYPGFPGELLVDETTGASYNGHGLNGHKFLLPAMWDPATSSCKTLLA